MTVIEESFNTLLEQNIDYNTISHLYGIKLNLYLQDHVL